MFQTAIYGFFAGFFLLTIHHSTVFAYSSAPGNSTPPGSYTTASYTTPSLGDTKTVYSASAASFNGWTTCSTPQQTNAPAYDIPATFGSSTASNSWNQNYTDSTYVYEVTGSNNVVSNNVLTSKPTYGWVKTGSGNGTWSGQEVEYCNVSSPKNTSGSKKSGTITWQATATGSGNSSTGTGYSYYVTSATITFDKAITYADQPQSNPTCTKTYGDGSSFSCSFTQNTNTNPNFGVTSDSFPNPGQRQICYGYTDPTNGYTTGNQTYCVQRDYVQSTTIVNPPTKAYTGIPLSFSCTANFYGGHTEDITSDPYVWSSSTTDVTAIGKGNYIGTNRYVYTDPLGRTYGNGNNQNHLTVNQFYAPMPKSDSYQISCTYYPSQDPMQSNSYVNDTTLTNGSKNPYYLPKTSHVSIQLEGISHLTLGASGQYWDQNQGKYVTFGTPGCTQSSANACQESIPNSQNIWNNIDFITGYWYNFDAFVTYADGTTRRITNANEVYWTGENLTGDTQGSATAPPNASAIVWYPGYSVAADCAYQMHSGCWQTGSPYYTDFPVDGLEHRIPQNNWNYVSVQYFNNVPDASYGTTVATGKLWAHQIVSLNIRGAQGTYASKPDVGAKNQSPPNPSNTNVSLTPVAQGSTHLYTAWVTWSDNPGGISWTNSAGNTVSGTPNPIATEQNQAQQQNWTPYVTWYSDDTTLNSSNVPINPTTTGASFTFTTRGTFYHTLDAKYVDQYGSLTTGNPRDASASYYTPWMTQYDTLMVYVQDGCQGNYLLVYQGNGKAPCIPTNNWQVNLQNYNPDVYDSTGQTLLFSTAGRSILNPVDYLPPTSIYGITTNWNQPISNPIDPYIYYYKFPVTGLSVGLSTSSSNLSP